MSAPEMQQLNPPEKVRVYRFPNGQYVRIDGPITGIRVSASGNHYLTTANGRQHIVAPGWLHIELNVEKFSV